MSKNGVLTVRILSDTQQAEAGLRQFESRVQSTGDKLQATGQKMTMFATVPIAAVMVKATQAASDLNETVSKSNTVFGDAADEVESWGESAAQTLGQSKRQALDAASTFGNLFVQLGVTGDQAADMSIAMTELASDFASFHNADISEVIDAQTAAFRGEYDALQRFVPTINAATVEQRALEMTGKATTSQLTAQDKALAVQKLMLEGAGEAAGDFARTQDSVANQTKIAKAAMEDASAEIGQALLPLVAKAAGGVADLAKGFGDLPGPIKTGILALGGLVAAAGPVLTVAGNISKMNSALRDSEGNLTRAGRGVATFGKALGVLGAAAVAYELYQMAAAARELDVDITAAARATDEELVEAFQTLEDFEGGLGLEMFRTLAEGSIGTARRLRDSIAETGGETAELDRILRSTAEGERRAATDADAAAGAVDELGGAAEEAAPKVSTYERSIVTATDRVEAMRDAIGELNDKVRAQFDPLFAAQDALMRNQEAQEGVAEAEKAAKKAQDDLNGAVWLYGRKSPEAKEAAWKLAEANEAVDEANRDAARSALDVTTATADLAGKMKSGEVDIASAREQIRLWAEQGLVTEEQARQMGAELDLVAVSAGELNGKQVLLHLSLEARKFWEDLAAARYALAETQIAAQLGGARTAGLQLASGGAVPGAKGAAVPATLHGGEYVLSADVVDGIKQGKHSIGRQPGGATGGGDYGFAMLSALRSIDRKLDRSAGVSIDGRRAGRVLRAADEAHALRNAS